MFNSRLKELREEKRYSYRDLAALCGVSKSAIVMYEQGKRNPKREVLEALADIFNVDMDYLLCRSDIRSAYANQIINSPTALSLTEGERKLLEVYRKASDDVKPVLVKAMESLESMPLDKLMLVAELFGK
jgi:transcriptional regulator with XRE-family HTH domain